MRRKRIITILLGVLVILSTAQIISDTIYLSKFKENAVAAAKSPEYCIFVEVEDKVLYLLKDGECIKQYMVASGKWGLPSPLGMWKVVEKGDWGEGFGGSWIGLNVPWGT